MTDTYDLRSRSINKFDIRSSRRRMNAKRGATSTGPRKPNSTRKENKKNDQAADENNNNGKKKKKKMGGKCPPPRKVSEKDVEEYKEQCRDAAEPALQYYNHHIAPNDGGIIYEMVDWGLSTGYFKPMEIGSKYHSNFTAKPLNSDDDSPPMLFFAEVWRDIDPDPPVVVLKCQRLGPQGQVLPVIMAAALANLIPRNLSITLLTATLMLVVPLTCSLPLFPETFVVSS